MNISVIIAAAGASQRMGLSRSKVLLPLLDRPVLAWSLELFQEDPRVTEIIVTSSKRDIIPVSRLCEKYSKARVVLGGVTRSISVTMALAQISSACTKVAVHDGARPLISKRDWDSLVEKAEHSPAVIPLTRMTDSIKSIIDDNIVGTLPRDTVAAVQTPQIFDFQLLLKAHRNALRNNAAVTDDSQMVEALGTAIQGVFTKDPNPKITYQEDLLFAEMLLRMQQISGQEA